MPLIYFSHANGFPGKSYETFFQSFRSPYEIAYTEKIGSAEYPIEKQWVRLTDQLLDQVSQYDEPVIGMGHSLGGVITAFAASRHPEYFQQLVLLDPPLFEPVRRRLIEFARFLGIADKALPPAKLARNRRTTFPDRAAAYEYWKPKRLFRNFDPRCFDDYVQYGLTSQGDGTLSLTIPSEEEAQIFVSLPTRFKQLQVQIPVHFLHSRQYEVLREKDVKGLSRFFPHMTLVPTEGGHMFPLERPQETAHKIMDLLN